MKTILFLCTGNSCRSQMAEGWAKHFWGHEFKIYSAGTKKHGLNALAVKVMREANVDISEHYSKTVEELGGIVFDYVVTVCDSAHETCPYFPGGKIIHVGFADPPTITKNMINDEEILTVYRNVRDEIKSMAQDLKAYLK